MLQLLLLVVGIFWAFRRPKLKALTQAQFPDVPAAAFSEWKTIKLKSVNRLLWASWGVLLISILSIPAVFFVAALFGGEFPRMRPDTSEAATEVMEGLQWLFFALFIVLVVMASRLGTEAAKLKKQHGIQWP